MSSAGSSSPAWATDRELHEFLARYGLETAQRLAPDQLLRALPGPNRDALLVEDVPCGIGLERVGRSAAAALADGGRFAFVLQVRRRPALLEQATGAEHDRGSTPARARWHDVCASLFRCGLWVDAYLLRRTFLWRRLRLPIGAFIQLADHAVIVGVRLVRTFEAQQNALITRLRTEGRTNSICAGSSMAPTFAVGDRLVFEPHTNPRAGEIVLMTGRASLLVHRVVAAVGSGDAGWVVHRGDAPGALPGVAAKWRVVGRLVEVGRSETTTDLGRLDGKHPDLPRVR